MRQHLATYTSTLRLWIKENSNFVRFAAAVILTHILWKVAFFTPDELTQTLFFGHDVTEALLPVSIFIANTVYPIVDLLSSSNVHLTQSAIHYDQAPGLLIIWGCSGIKQGFIFMAVIISAKGMWPRKMWYTPAGLTILYGYNLFRLTFLTLMNENHIEWFDFMHGTVFKVGYYMVIFLLWVLWINHFSGNKGDTNDIR